MQQIACNKLHMQPRSKEARSVGSILTVYDEDGDGDDACSEIAGDTLVDAVVSQRDVNNRQVADVL